MLRRSPRLLALATIGLTAAVLARTPATRARADDAPTTKRVTLLYTTDTHGHYHPHKDEKTGNLSGGFAALDAKVKSIRAQAKNPVFLLDSGDVMTGHPICDLESGGALGGALFRMMNAIGYDAWCVGNHDFDHGRENTAKLIELAKFPTVSANLKVEGDPPLKLERWKILEKDGFKLGVFGLMTEGLDKVTGKDKIKGITVTSAAAAAREAVAALKGKCDLIVALSHCGSDEDVKLADEVQGIDVILSGHNHRSLKPKRHGTTIVTEGFIKAEKLGELNLTVKDGKLSEDYTSDSVPLESAEATGDLKTVLDEVQGAIGKKLAEVLGKLEVPWKRDYNAESNEGNFFTDAIREAAQVDVAFLNSGGLRKNLGTGDITVGDIEEMLIGGLVVKFEFTGADLLKALEQNATASVSKAYGVLQVSGVKYTYRHAGNRSAKILEATCGGQPIDPKKTYTVATTDFIGVDQHEKYFGKDATVSKLEHTKLTLTQVAEDYVRSQAAKGPIKIDIEGRMKEEKK